MTEPNLPIIDNSKKVDSVSTQIYYRLRADLQKVWIREHLKCGKGLVIVDIVSDQVKSFYMPLESAKKDLIDLVNSACEKPVGTEGFRHFLVNVGDISNIYEEKDTEFKTD